MRAFSILFKNIKVLFRSKSSALIVLLAPLLIVMIIGFGFSDASQSTISVGVFNPEESELSLRLIDNLNTSENKLIFYSGEEQCIQGIKDGAIVTCVIFPTGLSLEDKSTNEIVFHVDDSRINLVYKIISTLNANIDIGNTQVTEEITTRLLEILKKTSDEVDASTISLVSIKKSISELISSTDSAKSKLSAMSIPEIKVSFSTQISSLNKINTDFLSLRSDSKGVMNKGYDLVDSLNSSDTDDLESALNKLNTSYNKTGDVSSKLVDLRNTLSNASKEIDSAKTQLKNTKSTQSAVISLIDSSKKSLASTEKSVEDVKSRQEEVSGEVASFKITNPELIAKPIKTKIESVTTKNTRITYSFPYLLMLVVLFVGTMLSSTLVMLDKKSRAYFRNFTIPLNNLFLIFMTYITTVLILVVQVAIIIAVVRFGLDAPVLNNIAISALVIFAGISVFSLLGIVIGNLFSTFESITMTTIAIGSIFIFVSNLVLPLETLSPEIQQIARYNPYVITSEAIRKVMLFNTGIEMIAKDLLILGLYCLIAGVLIVIINSIYSSKFFTRSKN
ncbi:MAG TPA: ABC transporter permease [Candidatus Woesearchaeota archaeon]|nr:ABC transporter permease [Candidatus Woesearchaeota archaeon]